MSDQEIQAQIAALQALVQAPQTPKELRRIAAEAFALSQKPSISAEQREALRAIDADARRMADPGSSAPAAAPTSGSGSKTTVAIDGSTLAHIQVPFGEVFEFAFKVWVSFVIFGALTSIILAALFALLGVSLFG